MNQTTKKCPLCAEEISLAAVDCPYCGASFKISGDGYCLECHEFRQADESGNCKTCGKPVSDWRVESEFIGESLPEHAPAPSAPTPAPIVKPQARKPAGNRLLLIELVVILVLAGLSAVLWFGRGRLPAASKPLDTPTTGLEALAFTMTALPSRVPTKTPTASSTPAPTSTPSPRPTSTATPLPQWMTDFAQPILNAIALRAPDFQDDFDDKSGRWQQPENNPCGQRIKIWEGEMVVTECRASRAHMDYPDFVVEFDARFSPDTNTSQAEWSMAFRNGRAGEYRVTILYDGGLEFRKNGKLISDFPDAAKAGLESNHITVAAQGPKIAIFVNGKPIYYLEDKSIPTGDIVLSAHAAGVKLDLTNPGIAAFDNFKIWDISDISTP